MLRSILLTLIGIIILVLGIVVERGQVEGNYPIYLVAVLWILLLLYYLILVNILLYKVIRRKFVNVFSFEKRFGFQMLLTLLFSLLYINLTYWIFKNRYTSLPPSEDQFILLNIYAVFFLSSVLSVQFGFLFLQKWKKASLEGERIKREQIRSELISLKAHLAPHFMFNNLNILSSLINVKNASAQNFLYRFSEVYRYVLKNKEAELVILKEELEFIASYIFLLGQRFHEELKVEIEIPNRYITFLIPPLALQMLIENALKHNIMSEEKPLLIKIYAIDEPIITVENSLELRNVPEYEKTGMGLDNIKRRYELISKQEISIVKEGNTFSVSLPLIQPN